MFKTAAANKHLNETTKVVGKFQISEPNLRFVEGTEAMHKSIPPQLCRQTHSLNFLHLKIKTITKRSRCITSKQYSGSDSLTNNLMVHQKLKQLKE